MASTTVKNITLIVGSLFIGGVITTGIHAYIGQPSQNTATAERKALFWYDPMYPNTKFDKPGKSPFMDMDLVPKYVDEDDDNAQSKDGIRIDPILTQNLGLRSEKVVYGKLNYALTVPASLNFNEYQYAIVQARSDGFIEKVYPLTIGDKVKKGTPLIELTIPQWVEAQSEYLLLAETGASAVQIKGILERLRLAGMSDEEIAQLRKTKKAQTHFVIKAPMDGVITAFDLRSGMNISKDKVVAKIQGVSPIWLNAAIPESSSYLLNNATQFKIHIPAYPDKSFKILKWDVLPSVDPITRTQQVRLALDNPNELLKPGMNAVMTVNSQSDTMPLIPSQAVIDSGDEQRVITLSAEGRFVPKLIKVFHESQQQTALLSGLEEGETVVVSGLFLIDSEANISGALARMRQKDTVVDSPADKQPQPLQHSSH
ncbi:efflux RND transporter periplasmic adaptor subunit [Budvicia diplopodorum]|uniref:efflux RND transporter periplasmic adaptor subunit n=1 Tax=Budvicia diplopodorum TaxID=1119056 RepID=UPI0013569598|nr:efflux RND transporter periplasmic adaptor subunit [Budvicia diplopodorum]